MKFWKYGELNAFTTGNSFWGQKLLETSTVTDYGALKGSSFMIPHPLGDKNKIQ